MLERSHDQDPIKHRAYHSWQLVFRNPPDFMKSGGFQVKSAQNPADFMKSAGFHECELLRDDQV